MMKTDAQLQKDIMDEIKWEPSATTVHNRGLHLTAATSNVLRIPHLTGRRSR
jgi:hypothetical protein